MPSPLVAPGAQQARAQEPDDSLPDGSAYIPAFGARGSLETRSLAGDGTLPLPDAVDALTLWAGSAALDAVDGSVLIAGHVDDAHQGAGALFELHSLQPGDAVYVTEGGVHTRWKVVALRAVVKERLPG